MISGQSTKTLKAIAKIEMGGVMPPVSRKSHTLRYPCSCFGGYTLFYAP